MGAPSILQQIYRDHLDHFGEPSHSIVFDDGKQRDGFPDRVDVMVWDPDEECDITTFATIGMATLLMPRAKHRAELHFAIRRLLTGSERASVAKFMANLAMYPFQIGEAVDWWHTIANPGAIPLFTAAQCVLFHPRFIEDGWDNIQTDDGEVHLLNIIPITLEEKDLRKIDAILESLEGTDIFTPR